MLIVSFGVKRAASITQLWQTDVGATTRLGPFAASFNSRASVCTVLPRPMSSARHAPNPSRLSRASHAKHCCW